MKYQLNKITGRHQGSPASHATSAAHSAKGGLLPKLKILNRIVGHPRVVAFAVLLALAAALGRAADTPQAAIAYRPGDNVRLFVTFKEPLSLKYAMARFVLNGDLRQGQKVFINMLDMATPLKTSEREYEFQAKVPAHLASGTYSLAMISATDDADFQRHFTAGIDFPVITICIVSFR